MAAAWRKANPFSPGSHGACHAFDAWLMDGDGMIRRSGMYEPAGL